MADNLQDTIERLGWMEAKPENIPQAIGAVMDGLRIIDQRLSELERKSHAQ